MNIHVLNIETRFLSLQLAEGFIKIDKEIKSILLVGKSNYELREKYKHLFKKLNFKKYYICNSKNDFIKYVLKKRDNRFIAHGLSYFYLGVLSITTKKTDWICWGAGSKINYNNYKSILMTPIKWFIYNRFRYICVLMLGDKRTLEKDFHLKRIILLPYNNNTSIKYKELTDYLYYNKTKCSNKIIRILVGNSTHNLESYYEIADMLSDFDLANIEISFMMQYPKLNESDLRKFLNFLDNKIPHKYKLDTELLDIQDYFNYISNHDVYICGAYNQSGLGAINACFNLGLTVYIRGKNLEWILNQNHIAYNLDKLKTSNSHSFQFFSEEEKQINRNQFFNHIDKLYEQWHIFLNK